jgi:hypothetical protein
VRLITQTSGIADVLYTTLSQRWGNSEKLPKLQKENLYEFEINIPLEKLPYTFRDAIRVTLAPHCNYLWIDSLCIIHDSEEDWASEGGRMAVIYGGAVCNISYVGCASDTSEAPSAALRDPRVLIPCLLYKAEGIISALRNPLTGAPLLPEGPRTYSLVAETFYNKTNGNLPTRRARTPSECCQRGG